MNPTEDRIKNLIRQEMEGISNIPVNESISQAIDLMHEAVHIRGGKVVISGLGKAGQIGHNIATTFSSTGTPSVFLHPTEAQHGDLDIKSISLTGHPENELGTLTDICLSTGYPKEVCPLGLTPTTSTTVMTVLGDILVVLMMEKINFTKSDYALRHHSGYLGLKSRENE